MKSLSYILFSLSLSFPVFGEENSFLAGAYDPNAAYSAMSIVESPDDDAEEILFYKALKDLASGEHSLTDNTDFFAIVRTELQDTIPEGAPTSPPADTTPPDTDGDGISDLPPDDDEGTADSDPTNPDLPGTEPVTATLKGISTNAMVTPDALMVAGVTITGGTKKVVFQVQATGTYAATDGYLQDPVLYIVNAVGAVIATVDNWQNGPDAGYDASLYSPSYLTELQNSAYAMSGANEAAIIMNLPEGSYTALVGSKSGTETAKAVVAAFDFETGATLSSLKGISTNATVTPSALMVAGVTVTGGTKKVVFQVQATGTYAATDGYLQDPVLYIVNAVGAVIATVDNWQNGPDAGYDATLYSSSYLTDLQNSAYAMTGAYEAAIIMNLPEGSYTALVGSKSGTETAKAVVAAFDFE